MTSVVGIVVGKHGREDAIGSRRSGLRRLV
jgi:hypothetical protein